MVAGFCFSRVEAQTSTVFAFTHVNVIPMNKEIVLTGYTLIVDSGRIKEMGLSSSIRVPGGATVVDAKGKYLIPALSDMHVHLEGEAWNIAFPPEKKFSSEEINFNDIFFLYIANGITTVEVMSAFPEHIPLREKIRKNEMLGPRLILLGMIDDAGRAWPPPISTWVHNPSEALDGNPLVNNSNTRKISGVMTRNRWISRAEIQKRLSEISESYARLRAMKGD